MFFNCPKESRQNLVKIFYLYNVKIEGEGVRDLSVVKIEKVKKFTM